MMHACNLPRNDHYPANTIAVCADCGNIHRLKRPDHTRTYPYWDRVYSVDLPYPIILIEGDR